MKMLKKENVLIHDEKRVFLKLFKKELSNQFNFSENSVLDNDQSEESERYISVVYSKTELIDFLRVTPKGTNILVCLFNEELYDNGSFMQEINSLISLKKYETKPGIIREIQQHFQKTPEIREQLIKSGLEASYIREAHFDDFYKALFLFS